MNARVVTALAALVALLEVSCTGGLSTSSPTASVVASSPSSPPPTGRLQVKAKPMGRCPKAVFSPGPPGTPLADSTIGRTAAATNELVFGLADRHQLFGFVFPAISTDGGHTWQLDGPCFYYAAAQGPAATTKIGALGPNWAYAWGRGGNFVKVTHDGGAHWFAANLPSIRRVTSSGRTLRAWLFGTHSLYISRDYGLTWQLVEADT